MSERLGNRNTVSGLVLAAVATVALSACGTENDSWVFEVECPAESNLDVIEIDDTGYLDTVLIQCSNASGEYEPGSIELLNGSGITVNDDGEVNTELLTIDYSHNDGFFGSGKATIDTSINEDDQTALIEMKNVDLNGVYTGKGE